ncbi:MAG: DNA polymerase III subunit epsilon [Rickettsiales bacterium]|jgi:DNA polymerase-3 subunit epsilon|nr:DNA polymerase III subunit epsilon [Rickettsiales bacterium]
MKREIILDTETTGLKPEEGHKLIEICAMEVVDGVKTGNIFHTYINPKRDVPEGAFKVHGISTEFLLDKKVFSEIAAEFVEFIKDSTLVIHNAKFDVGFLNYELKKLGHPLINLNEVVDTLSLARRKFPGSPANLDALCKRFKISLSKRDKHGAIIDVELLYEVYLHLLEKHLLIKTENDVENKAKGVIIKKEFREARNYNASKEELEAHAEFVKAIKEPIWNN